VLPILDNKILLVRHFRHATRKWHYEKPRGYVDSDEPEEQAATRELLEEIGAVAENLTHLGGMYTDTGQLGDYVRLYAATIRTTGDIARSEGIDEMRLLSIAEISKMIERFELSDSFSLAAILMARQLGIIPDF
jgi:ADP-ribose pyrophosphatase